MSSDFYGHLVELEPIEGATWKWAGDARDPTWRYATVQRGADVLLLNLHAPDTTIVRTFEGLAIQLGLYAGIVRGHDDGPWYDLTQLGIDRFMAVDGDTLRMWKLERT